LSTVLGTALGTGLGSRLASHHVVVVVLALAAVVGLVLLATLRRVREFEDHLDLSPVVTGLPFLALGAVLRHPQVAILSDQVLADLFPAFTFGNAWVGLIVGLNFDARRLSKLPSQLGAAIALETLIPMLLVAAACTGVLLTLEPDTGTRGIERDLIILAACAAASGPLSHTALIARVGEDFKDQVTEIWNLDVIVSLVVVGLVSCFFRIPLKIATWTLPGAAWFLLALGLGAVLGGLTYGMLRGAQSAGEELALLIGSVAFISGISKYLGLSSPLIAAIAGAVLANLPMRDQAGFKDILAQGERPLYLIFFVVAGAHWNPVAWQGWVLAVPFVVMRVLGKIAGAYAARRAAPDFLPHGGPLARALVPQSRIALVVIMTASTVVGRDHHDIIHWAVNAVVVGGMLTEVGLWLERAHHHRAARRLATSP
jgi:Kef-type K+ transport system membrane component KefB